LQIKSWPAFLTAAATRRAIDVLRHSHRWARLLQPIDQGVAWLRSILTAGGGPEPVRPNLHRPDLVRTDLADPEHQAIEQERAKHLRTAIGKLAQRQAQCFALRYLQGMEVPEIAVATGISENNVHVSLHRARAQLESEIRSIQLGDES
jgi:RNA polymerase sigma factor (sigma-70 family)